ncbi:MAG: hypothetical protein M3348_06100, partial [Acidobacteriota bacterium]|nr:hypothetical protein [Acidobacteriota bacterium]
LHTSRPRLTPQAFFDPPPFTFESAHAPSTTANLPRLNERPPDSRSKASAARTKERPRAHATHGRVTRMDGHEEGFSLGKFAVVMGAWALSKVGLSRAERKTH